MIEISDMISKAGEFRLHPLGFFYFVQRRANGVTRRVHVWSRTEFQRRANDRHQHSFDIYSTVLMGRIRSDILLFTEKVDGGEREFRVRYDDKRSSLSATGRRGALELITSFEGTAGTNYFLKAGAIHRVSILV